MAFTQYKKLSAQAYNTNNNTWGANGTTGSDLNTGLISLVDYALGGISTFTNPSGATSLSFTAGGGGDVQNCIWRWTGTITADTTVTTAAGDATTYLNGAYFWSNTTSGSFTITLTTANGSVVLPQGRRGILYVNNVNSVAPFIVAMVGSSTADPIPTGSVMLFYQNAAPSGWTLVTSQNNKALRVVSSAGGVAGGTNSFSTVFAQSATGSHVLTTSEIPAHTHAAAAGNFVITAAGSSYAPTGSGSGTSYQSAATASAGSGGGHTHTFTMDVAYIDVLLCSRD